MKKLYLVTALLLVSSMAAAETADPLKAFPPAGPGMVRHVLQLPKQADEAALKVELIVGKTVEVDAANRYFFAGKLEEQTIEGWGYPRYVVSELGPMAGTLMAVAPNAPKVSKFVSLGIDTYLVRYNSLLPVVVYAPEGAEVRYRLWRAAPEVQAIDKG